MIPLAALPAIFGGGGGYVVDGAMQFKAASSQYLNKTFAGAPTSRRKGTVRFILQFTKLGVSASQLPIFGTGNVANDSDFTEINIGTTSVGGGDYKLTFAHRSGGGTVYGLATTNLYRDVTGFIEVVLTYDTTLATPEAHFYINGVEPSYSVNNFGSIVQNTDLYLLHTAYQHNIGRGIRAVNTSYYFDGYLADLLVVDGAVVAPSNFSETDDNGYEAQPIKPVVSSYGTNGFWFEGSTFGTDRSGNGNDFTASGSPVPSNNSPTNDPANDVGLYAVLSALWPSTGTISNAGTSSAGLAVATLNAEQGDFYWEITANAASVVGGLLSPPSTVNTVSVPNGNTYGFKYSSAGVLAYTNDGTNYTNIATGLSGVQYPYATGGANTFNFGTAGTFTYTVPTGFTPLCTAHLDDDTIADPVTGSFTGNASTDGPVVWLGGPPDTAGSSTINGNAITWGTHAIPLATGFKVITNSASYNASGSNTFSIATLGLYIKKGTAEARAQ